MEKGIEMGISEMMVYDGFGCVYGSEEQFMQDLSLLMKEQEWKYVPIREMKIRDLPNVPMLIGTTDLNIENLAVNDRTSIMETMQKLGLMLETNKETYLMRTSSFNSLLQRAQISGRSINRLYEEKRFKFVEHMNLYLSLYGEKAKVLIRGGRTAAVLSKDYAIINQKELFQRTFGVIKSRFDNYDFIEGYIGEEFSTSLLKTKSDVLLYTEMKPLLDRYDCTEAIPTIRIITSDIGVSHAKLVPMITTEKGTIIAFGDTLEVKHIGNKTVEDFLEKVEVVFPKMLESVNRIKELKELVFDNGDTIMKELGKKYKVPTPLINTAITNMIEIEGDGPVTGTDLYYYFCDILDVAKMQDYKPEQLVAIEEAVGRILISRNWARYDYPGVK